MPADPRDLLPLLSQDLHVLLTLAEGPRHAYGLATAVSDRPGGVRLELGSLYRMLARLTTLRVIEDCDPPARRESAGGHEARRRYYQITTFGRRVAEAEVTRLEAVVHDARKRKLVPARNGR